MLLQKLVSLAVPTGVALTAFLNAHAIGSLIDATAMPASSIAPFAEARAAAAIPAPARSSRPILARNPFDHETRLLETETPVLVAASNDELAEVPACEGVRA